MAQPESIIVAHYEAIRAEIMERIRLRDQYLVWFVTLSAAAIGVYIKDQDWWGLLAGVPILTCLTGLMYWHTDVTLGSLGCWLRVKYGRTLLDYKTANGLCYPIEFWDHSLSYRSYATGLTFALRYLSAALVVLGVGVASCVLVGAPLQREIPDRRADIIMVALWLLVGLGAAGPICAWRVRATDLKEPNPESQAAT